MYVVLCPGCQKKFKLGTPALVKKWMKHRKKCKN